MPRYFIELAYKGTKYHGFQVQENAVTIQSEVENAFKILHRHPVSLTGSSRTDSGVHALQNFFHFDYVEEINPHFIYKMNSILQEDIVIKNLYAMPDDSHSRFDAKSREYEYRIHQSKNPFLKDRSYFYPYKLDMELMQEAARIINEQTDFFAFCKSNTQVKNLRCQIMESKWQVEEEQVLIYTIKANRFLRGMVRLLTGSLLKVGRKKLEINDFKNQFIVSSKSAFSVPPHGLFLSEVTFPENYFPL